MKTRANEEPFEATTPSAPVAPPIRPAHPPPKSKTALRSHSSTHLAPHLPPPLALPAVKEAGGTVLVLRSMLLFVFDDAWTGLRSASLAEAASRRPPFNPLTSSCGGVTDGAWIRLRPPRRGGRGQRQCGWGRARRLTPRRTRAGTHREKQTKTCFSRSNRFSCPCLVQSESWRLGD